MGQIELIKHIENYNTVRFQGLVYSYDKNAKVFIAKDNRKMSLDFALAHADEIQVGWAPVNVGVDLSASKDEMVMTSYNGDVIVDIKTQKHL